MRIKLLSLISFIIFSFNYNASAQISVSKQYPFLPGNAYTIERQDWNVNSLTLEIAAPVTQADLDVYNENLSRVFIVKTNASLVESYINLSSVQVRNKYNSNLVNDYSNFVIANFNPLKYFFNFYSPSQLNYRVDNTDYMIIIVPSKTN